MQGYYSESYLPLADLVIRQSFADASPTNYYRDLNISDAIATTRFYHQRYRVYPPGHQF